MSNQEIDLFSGLSPGVPLWKIAPTRDEDGRFFVDFMMIIPKLKKKPQSYIERTLKDIEMVLEQHKDLVVFANLNLNINCLWVSHRARPGFCQALATAIRHRVPEALLVGDLPQ